MFLNVALPCMGDKRIKIGAELMYWIHLLFKMGCYVSLSLVKGNEFVHRDLVHYHYHLIAG